MGSVPHVSRSSSIQGYECLGNVLGRRLMLPITGDSQDVNVFADIMKPRGAPPPGLPQFNPNRVVSHVFDGD